MTEINVASTSDGPGVRPEVVAWFHEGEEQCPHDYVPWTCEVSADALLRAFTVTPRMYENRDGTVSFESGHFRRIAWNANDCDCVPGHRCDCWDHRTEEPR